MSHSPFFGPRARLLAATVLTSFAALVSSPVHAQSTQPIRQQASNSAEPATTPPAEGSDEAAPEITVTANTKFGRDLQQAPVAATSIGAAELARDRIQTVQDVAIRVPSLVFNNPSNFAQAYIRGLGSNFSLAGLESAVATYVDGVYLQRQNGAVVDLVDLAGVRVLKGPQGTLYGRNATGGVILVETADPVNRTEGQFNFELGRFNSIRVQAVANLPVTDTLAVRISAQITRNDNYSDNVYGNGSRGAGSSQYVRGKVKWSPTNEFSLVYSLEHFNAKSTSFSQRESLPSPYCQVCFLFGTPAPLDAPFYQHSQSNGSIYNNKLVYTAQTLKLNYDTERFLVSSTTGYRRQKTPLVNDQEFMPAEFLNTFVNEHGPTLYNDTFIRTKLTGPLNFLFGESFLRERNNQDVRFFGIAFGPLIANNRNEVKVDSISVYGEATYEITPGLTISGGARYNRDKKVIDVTNDAAAQLGLGLPASAASFRSGATFKSVPPRVVLSYENDGDIYYASYNRGERSGGFGSPIISPGPAVDPESLDNFEIGAKNSFLDDRLTTNLALFYGIYKDIQVQIVDSATGSVLLQNAAKGKVSGIEFDARLRASERFNIAGGVTYLNNKFKNFPDANVFNPFSSYPGDPNYPVGAPGCGSPGAPPGACGGLDGSLTQDLSGTRLPRSPKFAGFASADYTLPLSSAWALRTSAIARFTTKYVFTAGAGGSLRNDRQRGFTKVDGSIALVSTDGKTEMGLYGRNIFNAHFLEYAQTSSFGGFQVRPMPPSYGVRLNQRF